MVALDQGDDFDIIGGFKSTWRAHAWEGDWVLCMFFSSTELTDHQEVIG